MTDLRFNLEIFVYSAVVFASSEIPIERLKALQRCRAKKPKIAQISLKLGRMTKNDTRQCLINFIQENTYTFDEVQFSVPVPTFYAWVSYGQTCESDSVL